MTITEPIELPLSLGRQIAQARRNAGYASQTAYARARGIHRNTVGRWERDLEVPDFAEVVRLSNESGRPLAFFAAAVGRGDAPPDQGNRAPACVTEGSAAILPFRSRRFLHETDQAA